MQERTASSENSSVKVQSKDSHRKNTCMTSSKHNQVSIPPKRFRIRLSDDGGCYSSQQEKAFDSMKLQFIIC